jgi:hypothetical protein
MRIGQSLSKLGAKTPPLVLLLKRSNKAPDLPPWELVTLRPTAAYGMVLALLRADLVRRLPVTHPEEHLSRKEETVVLQNNT